MSVYTEEIDEYTKLIDRKRRRGRQRNERKKKLIAAGGGGQREGFPIILHNLCSAI